MGRAFSHSRQCKKEKEILGDDLFELSSEMSTDALWFSIYIYYFYSKSHNKYWVKVNIILMRSLTKYLSLFGNNHWVWG